MNKTYISFDIETVKIPIDSFDIEQQDYLFKSAETEEDKIKKINEMSLSPMTAKIACIGLNIIINDNKEFSGAFVIDNNMNDDFFELIKDEPDYKIFKCTEYSAIDKFWKIFVKYKDSILISFNGRNFDCPFIMLRSALLGIVPSRNLMDGTRYNYKNHIDLLDELTFYGSSKKYNFDFYARSFGIKSPKEYGVDGSKVDELYKNEEYLKIGEYCLRDVEATWKLYNIIYKYLYL